jgi:hypothetical protein
MFEALFGGLGSAVGLAGQGATAEALRRGNALGAFAAMLQGPEITALPPELRSAFEDLQQDQGLLGRRTAALDNMKAVMDNKGADPAFMQALNTNLNRTGRQIAGQDQGLMQSAARRGVGGSGLEFATRRGNQANAYDSMAGLGANIAGQQMDRFDKATSGYFGSATTALNNDNQFNAGRASARDSINRFNNQNNMDRWRAQNRLNQSNTGLVRDAGSQGFSTQGNINANWQQANNAANQGYISSFGRALGS